MTISIHEKQMFSFTIVQGRIIKITLWKLCFCVLTQLRKLCLLNELTLCIIKTYSRSPGLIFLFCYILGFKLRHHV